MNGSLARGQQLAAQLRGDGISAVTDVGKALANLPCILVVPPRLEFDVGDGATATWKLMAIAADGTGSSTAWQQLDDLVAAATELLPIELAEPTSYQLGQGIDPLPAYALTYIETID